METTFHASDMRVTFERSQQGASPSEALKVLVFRIDKLSDWSWETKCTSGAEAILKYVHLESLTAAVAKTFHGIVGLNQSVSIVIIAAGVTQVHSSCLETPLDIDVTARWAGAPNRG